MLNVKIFTSVSFIYLFASLAYCCYPFLRKEALARTATGLAGLGLGVHTIGYIVRWAESYKLGVGHTPFAFFTLYETLVFTCWALLIFYLVIEYKYGIRALGTVLLPLAALCMLYVSLSPCVSSEIRELPSVLQGNYLMHHVISHFIGYCFFLTSFVLSMVILFKGTCRGQSGLFKKMLDRFPPAKVLDRLNYKIIAVGFIFYSIGMATGVYRAKVIWGSYWRADAAEVISLIQWLLYALILHGRYQRWCGMRATSILSIVAFIIAVIAFFISMGYMLVSGHYPF